MPDKAGAIELIHQEVGHKFTTILEHAGVYKQTAEGQQAFQRFLIHMGYIADDK